MVAPVADSALAANTSSLLESPDVLGPVSYQTTHGTASLAPVNAISGSIPSRCTSTLRLGSAPPGPTRLTPTSWKQKPPIGGLCPATGSPAGGTLSQLSCPGPIGFDTKI